MGVDVDSERFRAVVFDLDGVITDNAKVHLSAWQRLFDEALRELDGTIDDGVSCGGCETLDSGRPS